MFEARVYIDEVKVEIDTLGWVNHLDSPLAEIEDGIRWKGVLVLSRPIRPGDLTFWNTKTATLVQLDYVTDNNLALSLHMQSITHVSYRIDAPGRSDREHLLIAYNQLLRSTGA